MGIEKRNVSDPEVSFARDTTLIWQARRAMMNGSNARGKPSMGNMSELLAQARHRISACDFHRMADVGILTPSDRVELIDGEIVDMAPIGSKHAFVVSRLARFFTIAAGESCLVSAQNPVHLDEHSEPQHDLALLRPGDYMDRLPSSDDVLLIVEVAVTSAEFDREVKLGLYAKHGIPEVWLLDLNAGLMSIYREPEQGRYRVELKPGADEVVSPMRLPAIGLRLESGKSWSVPF